MTHVLLRPEQFIIGTTGRQVGKTEEIADFIDTAMCAEPDPLDRTGSLVPAVAVLGPTYEKAELSVKRYIDRLTRTFGQDSYHLNQNKHELTITDPAAGKVGAMLKWISGDDAYNVVGFSFSAFAVDEAQAIPDDVWFKFIPVGGARHASGLIFGTPDITTYQTWFQGLWLRGQDPLDTNYYSFSIRSDEAPWMSTESIIDAKHQLPESVFRRLYGGEWVEEQGLVFTGIETALLHGEPTIPEGRRLVMAVDLAVTEDFNVVMVGDPATKTALFRERWNKTDPLVTCDRIIELWERFGKPKTVVDESGMGGKAMVAVLRSRGMRVQGVTFTHANKSEMLHQLVSDIQHRKIMFPAWDDLLREFRSFVYGRSPSGKVTAGAIVGSHDDLVMTLVMLNHAFHTNMGSAKLERYNYLTGR